MQKKAGKFGRILRSVVATSWVLLAVTTYAAKEAVAELKISGLGWIGDWEMRVSLERLLGKERGALPSANTIEDAMFLLMSAVQDDGYLKPELRVDITAEDGKHTELALDSNMLVAVP